jgi:glycine reductase
MFLEKPAVEFYRKSVHSIETANRASGIAKAMSKVVEGALKLLLGRQPGSPRPHGYIPQGIKVALVRDRLGAKRAVDLLLKKIKEEPFGTGITFPNLDSVPSVSRFIS